MGLVILLPALALLVFYLVAWSAPFPEEHLSRRDTESWRLLDRHGRPLREALGPMEGRGHWRSIESVSPWVPLAFIAIEDHRFFDHSGVDWRGVARAAIQNLQAGEVVAGGSTLTQQVVKHMRRAPRSLRGKLDEALLAVRLEQAIGKQGVLTEYVNRVPFGHGTFGIEAASRFYLDKSSAALSLAEAALLAGIPRAPSLNNPLSHQARSRKRQRVILDRMLTLEFIDEATWREALSEPITLAPGRRNLTAPHFTTWALSQSPAPGVVPTTLDLDVQRQVERIVSEQVNALSARGVSQGAAVVLDTATGELLAWVGSADFFDPREGQVDMVIRRRQPGSTLKPFVYGLAMEKGPPHTPLPDLPVYFSTPTGRWSPRNYDRTFHGWVYPRQALACSYNVPAVWVTEQVGVPALLQRLRRLGFTGLDQHAGQYGLGLALGNAEVRLLDLANAYRTLANGGRYSPPRWRQGEAPSQHTQIMPAHVAHLITDMLSDPVARAPAFGRSGPLETPYPAAAKTGTSADFSDAWTVGFTDRFTVGVWVGNFDGAPMKQVSGGIGAAPLWRAVMDTLTRGQAPRAFSREGLTPCTLCARPRPNTDSADLTHCEHTISEWCIADDEDIEQPASPAPKSTAPELSVQWPQRNDAFALDPDVSEAHSQMLLRARAPQGVTVRWLLDEQIIGETSEPDHQLWWSPERGRHRLAVATLDDHGRTVATSPTVAFSVYPMPEATASPRDALSSPSEHSVESER
ncbi:MAG: penicillin-binding protein 1C [Bradymonadia bacterium]